MSRHRSHGARNLINSVTKSGLPTPAIIGIVVLLKAILISYCCYKCFCRQKSNRRVVDNQSNQDLQPTLQNNDTAQIYLGPDSQNSPGLDSTGPYKSDNSPYPAVNPYEYNPSAYLNYQGGNLNQTNGTHPSNAVVGSSQCNLNLNPYPEVKSTNISVGEPMYPTDHIYNANLTYPPPYPVQAPPFANPTATEVATMNTIINPPYPPVTSVTYSPYLVDPAQNNPGINASYPAVSFTNNLGVPSHPAVNQIQHHDVNQNYPAANLTPSDVVKNVTPSNIEEEEVDAVRRSAADVNQTHATSNDVGANLQVTLK